MNISEQSPIYTLINRLSERKGSNITFEDLKGELSRKDEDGKPIYNVNFKEDDDLALIYYTDSSSESTEASDLSKQIEDYCRSYIIEKSSLKPIGSQFNRIIYNEDAKEFLSNKDWRKVVVQTCYEGTMLLVFYHNEHWHVSTRRCLNSDESTWIKDKSYWDMFEEARDGKFELDDLDKDYCYHFILVHHKNRNIVNYSRLGREYKELFHTLTTEKYTLNEVEDNLEGKVNKVISENFESYESLLKTLDNINTKNEMHNNITTEGFVLRVYEGEVHKSPFKVVKLQTPVYQKIMRIKPNNSNIHQSYLELYQKDRLSEFLPFFSKYNNDIIKRINQAVKNVAREILDLYHCTRQKKNPQIYNNLTDQYKKILYGLHGLYIEDRKQDFNRSRVESNENHNEQHNGQQDEEELINKSISRSINVHDVYHYLKSIPPNEFRQIFYERMLLLDNDEMTFLNSDCIYSKTQSMLMFGLGQGKAKSN